MQDQRQPTPEAEFARRTRLLRDALGWSQTELAARLTARGIKVDGTAITRLERGTRAIRLNEAVAIAEELGVSGVNAMLRPPAESPEEQLQRADAEMRDAARRALWANAEHDAARARLDRLEREARGETVEPPATSWDDLPEHWDERPR